MTFFPGFRRVVGRLYDVMAIWHTHATDVRGRALPGRHFLAEELPDATLQELHAFFSVP